MKEFDCDRLIRTLPFGVTIWRIETDEPEGALLIWANNRASAETGIDLSPFVGKTVGEVFPAMFDTDIPRAWAQAAKTDTPETIYDVKYEDENLPFRRYDVHLIPLGDRLVALVYQNVTAQRKAEERVRRQVGQLERTNRDLEQFAYVASHDLREPLVSVAGFATLFKKRFGDKLDEQGARFVNQIIDGTKRMEEKIDDLLRLSRAGRNSPEGAFPLGGAVEEAQKSLVGAISRSGAEVETIGNMPMIHGDRGMIAQVFQNLFSNSIKYRGNNTPHIEVRAVPNENCPLEWTISVKDNGLGFDMRHKERIFGVFQRLYTIEEYPGTGIGLAIVKKIVERHKGRIWVESEEGKGATFFFTLEAANES